MFDFKVGEIVGRKSYGSDVHFRIVDVVNRSGSKPVYVLKGLLYRIHADCPGDDLEKLDSRKVYEGMQRELHKASRYAYPLTRGQVNRMPLLWKFRTKTGKILHIDSSEEYMKICLKHYRGANITAVGKLADENRQPEVVGRLLQESKPDILVLTGHDGIKKNPSSIYSLDNYWNSRYFIQSVKEARKYEPSFDKLCIFAGACQSYYEAIMDAGANFASSPGRILINALDPAFVAEKVSITDHRYYVTPEEIASIITSGKEGIGGVRSKGQMT
jgi:spore coat assembly protein